MVMKRRLPHSMSMSISSHLHDLISIISVFAIFAIFVPESQNPRPRKNPIVHTTPITQVGRQAGSVPSVGSYVNQLPGKEKHLGLDPSLDLNDKLQPQPRHRSAVQTTNSTPRHARHEYNPAQHTLFPILSS
jgi:hypothetical protein